MLAEMRIEKRGKRATLEKTLTIDDILPIVKAGKCQLTGLMFDFKPSEKTFRNPYAPSLDRIDSHKGYTKDNVRVVLTAVNEALGEHTDEEILPILEAMVKGIKKNAQKKSVTPVSTGSCIEGAVGAELGSVSAPWTWEDSNDANDYRGAVQGENSYRSAKEGGGDSVGHRGAEVGTLTYPEGLENSWDANPPPGSAEEFFRRVRRKSRELDLAIRTGSKIRQSGD